MIHNVKLELLIKHRNEVINLHFTIRQKYNCNNIMIVYIFSKLCRNCKNVNVKTRCHDLHKIIWFN